jgi:hypothetical protein
VVPWAWPPTEASALLTVVATRQLLNALKLSCRILKHVAGACSSSLSLPAAENANTRLRIDDETSDCALRNDSDDEDEENADEEQEDDVGEPEDLGRRCRMILGRMALKKPWPCLHCLLFFPPLPVVAATAADLWVAACCLAL